MRTAIAATVSAVASSLYVTTGFGPCLTAALIAAVIAVADVTGATRAVLTAAGGSSPGGSRKS